MPQRTGIRERHSRSCASRNGARCNCEPSFEACVFSKRDGKKIRKTFSGKGALSAAKNWRADALKPVREGTLRAPSNKTVRQAVDEFLRGAEAGEIRNKRKQPYKPAVVRQYRSTLEKWFLPEFEDWRLAKVENADLLALKERLLGKGIADSTVRNVFVPVQAIFRRAKRMGDIPVNPAMDLDLPVGDNGRERAATPTQAAELIEALPEDDQALWAAAFYGGFRRGELQALRPSDIFDTYINIAEDGNWDAVEARIAPKSKASIRRVPKTNTLGRYLDAHLERTGRAGEDLLFGRAPDLPFTPHHVSDRADEVWEAAGLERFTLHEARHSFSTWLDAAGISEERSDRYMGHSRGGVASRYRHLLPGQLAEDAAKIDAYLSGATAGKVVALDVAS
jgi:integrase